MSKQDRQGMRRVSEVEQKFNLSLLNDLKRTNQSADFSNINQILSQLMVRLQNIMPIGSIHTTLNEENPSSIYGGEWELISEGYLIVGLDTEDIPQILQTVDKCYIWKRIS